MEKENISGTYVYRSLQNDRNLQTNFEELEFGRGDMIITQDDDIITGNFDMGGDYKMRLEGKVYSSDVHYFLKMTAYGISGTVTDKWIYEYSGTITLIWPNAVAQIPTITGGVIRTKDHGNAKAGAIATFYMVLKI